MALAIAPIGVFAAPYADFVVDARTGEVLHQDNADTRLHPASLTKMMTLYIAFEAIERGEISLDSKVTISKHAASQPPSKLGLRAGQTIALRYLIRAAAIKSANDAATAIGEAIEGSESAFAKRMNRTAKALGMSRSTFANANGLTAKGHLSTARDMTTLGRHLFFDYPQYYNLFSRTSADAGVAQVASTNRRFLGAYKGADGIKTGYTSAAGFNLTASAQRGNKRIIATVFGGKSTATRNARVAELLDLGFGKAPNRVAVQKPARPVYVAQAEDYGDDVVRVVAEAVSGSRNLPAGKTIRLDTAVKQSPMPKPRPVARNDAPPEDLLLAMQDKINAVLAEAQTEPAASVDSEKEVAEPIEVTEAPKTEAEAEAAAPEETVVAAAPSARPAPAFVQTTTPQPESLAAIAPGIAPEDTPKETVIAAAPETSPQPAPAPRAEPAPAEETIVIARPAPAPKAAEQIVLASLTTSDPVDEAEELEVVTRVSTSGGRQWSINVGHFPSRYNAERQLLRTALVEMNTLDEALRKVVARRGGYDANFVGMTEEMAELACRRLQARQTECTVIGP